MKHIRLFTGEIALVSDDDADLARFKWHRQYGGNKKFPYAATMIQKHTRQSGIIEVRYTTECLHRMVAYRLTKDLSKVIAKVKFRDGNRLNCTRENLMVIYRK